MVVKVGINGFGRIGRLAFRRIQNVEGVEVKDGGFEVNGKFVKVSA